MKRLEFAVDENPNPDKRGKYGIIVLIGGSTNNIKPIGDQTFPSEEGAVNGLCRALGQLVKTL